jgi:hypothetical protein
MLPDVQSPPACHSIDIYLVVVTTRDCRATSVKPIDRFVVVKEDRTMEETPKGKGLQHFLSWEATHDQDSKGHPREWLKAFAFVLFILILTCVGVFWTCNN